MPLDLLALYERLPVFLLVVSRLAGLIMLAPGLSALSIPRRVVALLAIGLAALITPLVAPAAALPGTLPELAGALAGELLLGIVMGLTVRLIFLGLQLGGTLIAQESGLAFGALVDPTLETEESVLSVFYLQLGLVIYLVIGGHRALVAAALDTFHTLPLLVGVSADRAWLDLLLTALQAAAQLAIRTAAPVIVALVVVNVVLGFLSRTVPQLNVITLGFSLKGLLSFVLIAAALPAGLGMFIDAIEEVFRWIRLVP